MIIKQTQHIEVVRTENAVPTQAGSSIAGEAPETKPSFALILGTDQFHFRIAEDWIGLGDYTAASEQLEKISPGQRTHPSVLKMRWQLCVYRRNWEAALDVASTLILLDPKDSLGWTHQSFALHELKRTVEARDNLVRVVETFPDNAAMRYNLACYECQLGRTEEAKGWLSAACKLNGNKRTAEMALTDFDLAPLHEWIRLETGLSCSKASLCDGIARLPHTAPIPPSAEVVAA